MAVAVHIPRALRAECAGAAVVSVATPGGTAASLADLLTLLGAAHPALRLRLADEQGRLRPHVNVFVDGSAVGSRDRLDRVPVGPAAEVWILPAVSGGAAPVPPAPGRGTPRRQGSGGSSGVGVGVEVGDAVTDGPVSVEPELTPPDE